MTQAAHALTVRQALAQAGLAPLDAQVLLAHVLGVGRAWLAAHATDRIAPRDVETFFALARRRRDGEPVAYLTGTREFFGLPLTVDPSVLIPRPETETLVEAALHLLDAGRPRRVLDLGTGSGAIALAIAHERPRADVLGVDRSAAALAVAARNAGRLKLANVRWLQSDWYEHVDELAGAFDVIASNPPYVADGDPHLAEGDVRFEPHGALRAGPDGLSALRVVVAGAPARLAAGGALVVEHGFDQAEAVRALVHAAGLENPRSLRDLAGIPRVCVARKPS
ncbi:MAG TPA: peptide chain release factor N(5)-glutamine methyltransferase [Casimicrobiaceae bacterium]|nr:peptide chain release factor N(5)-glutamine methyltransferase [Casimicrobiaceae bacterium]